MSIGLSVALPRSMDVNILLSGAAIALNELIPGHATRHLAIVRLNRGKEEPLDRTDIGVSDGEGYLIRMTDFEATFAQVMLVIYDPMDGHGPELKLRCGIEVSGTRTNLAFVLGAALAISFSRELKVEIDDTAHAWTHRSPIPAHELVEQLALLQPVNSLTAGAAVIYSASPIGSHEATLRAADKIEVDYKS